MCDRGRQGVTSGVYTSPNAANCSWPVIMQVSFGGGRELSSPELREAQGGGVRAGGVGCEGALEAQGCADEVNGGGHRGMVVAKGTGRGGSGYVRSS